MAASHVSFGPCDTLNPRCGYQIRIEDEHGECLLFTGNHPVTGKPLDFASCIEIAAMYIKA